jgi:DNA-binding MarR family transcriptional regulator
MDLNYTIEYFKTMQRLKNIMHRNITEKTAEPLGRLEMIILHIIGHKTDLNPSYIAEQLELPFSTLTGILDRMEKKQLISRNRSIRDRRAVIVNLSTKGKKLKQEYDSLFREYLDSIRQDLPENYWQHLYLEISKLEQIIKGKEEQDD